MRREAGCIQNGLGLESPATLERSLGDLLEEVVDELLGGLGDRLLFTANADGDGAVFDFFLAEDGHVRDAF